MNLKTFKSKYCQRYNVLEKDFENSVLKEALYPHARFLTPLLHLLYPEYLEPDRDFIQSVARIKDYAHFFDESLDFSFHPKNVGIARRTLNLRISTRRMRNLVRNVLGPDSVPPANG